MYSKKCWVGWLVLPQATGYIGSPTIKDVGKGNPSHSNNVHTFSGSFYKDGIAAAIMKFILSCRHSIFFKWLAMPLSL